MADSVSGKVFDMKLLRRILRYVKPYRVTFYSAFGLTILLSALTTARPLLIQHTIDNFIMEPQPDKLLQYILILVGLLILEAAVQFLFIYSANFLGQSIIRDLRIQLYNHILSFKLQYFDTTPIGKLVTRAVNDIETIANIFSQGILTIFGDLLKILVMILAMFYFFDVTLVLVALSVVPILYYATRLFQIKIKKAFQEVRNQVAALNSFTQEHISGMNIVQMFNREEAEMNKFQEINDKHRQANIRSIWYFSIFLPVIEIMSAISIGLVVWYGGLQAAEGGGKFSLELLFYQLTDRTIPESMTQITLGEITAIIIFINMLFRPLRQLADRFNTLQMGMVASERVFRVLETDSHIEDKGQLELDQVKGDITFKDVYFGYNPDETILKGVSFHVNAGETLAIVGATGAGKSTVINLLSRFYEIDKGEILLDGNNIRDLKLQNLRAHLAVVLQDVFLFSDTIYQNIVLNQDVSRAEVAEAAGFIGVSDFIESLPGQYDYNVQERGNMLSVGQRQLLAFLRAYVSNPSVLILDEATSSVDTQSEMLIQQAIEKITKGRTSIVIAHRLATIKKAHNILVMDQGQIVEQGTHDELLARNGYYTRLYEMQFKEEATRTPSS